jgi:hypothetical protein
MRTQINICHLLLCINLMCLSCLAAAEDSVKVMRLEEGAVSPPANIESIAWLEGRWVGEGLGGSAEEIIAPAVAGQMMGMFRHLKSDEAINFYEFYIFAEHEGSLTLRLKHFSPMLSGWEEREEFVEFPLVALEINAAYFDGLTYLLGGDDNLSVGVRIAEDKIATFNYRKAE